MSSLDGSDSDVGAVNLSRLPMINNGGASLLPIESNASKTVDRQDCYDPQSGSTQQPKKSHDLCSRVVLSCPLRNQNADHICAIQTGGFDESADAGFDPNDDSISEENAVILLSDVSLIHLYYHIISP